MDDRLEEQISKDKNGQKTAAYQRLAWFLALFAILTVMVVFYVTKKNNDVPPELIGVWKTTNPTYADRFLEIREVTISFGTGDAKEFTGFIKNVRATHENSRTTYVFTYASEGQDQEVSFTLAPENHNALRFKNQDGIVWVKE